MRNRSPLALLSLLAALLLAGCSSLSVTLGYNQSPRLAAWWIDGYLDLDRTQGRQLDIALREFLAWHRRHELPQLVTLLQHADAALDGGVSEAELQALEDEFTASVERSLQHAAPLAQPILASLRPQQWQHLRERQARRLAEAREEQADPGQRGKAFEKSLERWLGDLDKTLRRQARAEAAQWPLNLEAALQSRVVRQADTVSALHAWAAGDGPRGTALILKGSSRDVSHRHPAEAAMRQAVTATMVRLLAAPDAAQLAHIRAHWAAWQRDLRALGASS